MAKHSTATRDLLVSGGCRTSSGELPSCQASLIDNFFIGAAVAAGAA